MTREKDITKEKDVPPERLPASQRGLAELDQENIFAVMVVGDDYVEASTIRSDPGGFTYPIRAARASLGELDQNHTPSVDAVCRVAKEAWDKLKGPRLEYGRFLLCLPSWLCESKEVSAEIELRNFNAKLRRLRVPLVNEHHLPLVVERVCEKLGPDHVVIDLWPGSWVVGRKGRRVEDPVGASSRTLRLEAYAVTAELGPVKTLLKSLAKIGIHVDLITAPCSAAMGVLAEGEDADAGICVADVDRLSTTISAYVRGKLRYSGTVTLGSNHVMSDVMRHHSGDREELVEELVAWEKIDAGLVDGWVRELELWQHILRHPALHLYDAEAAQAITKVFRGIERQLKIALVNSMLPVSEVLLMQDDDSHLTERGLSQALKEYLDIPIRTVVSNTWQEEELGVKCGARAIALVRFARASAKRLQPFLDRYNEGIVEAATRRLGVVARSFVWELLRYLTNVRENAAARRARRTAKRAEKKKRKKAERPPVQVPSRAPVTFHADLSKSESINAAKPAGGRPADTGTPQNGDQQTRKRKSRRPSLTFTLF